jgi:hypothetical protein
MKTLMTVKKILEKTTVTAATAVMLRIVLTTMSLPRRLTSLAEMLENLPLTQFYKTCKFVGCEPLSKQLSYKLYLAQVLQGGPMQDVIPLRIHRGNQVISSEA